VKAGDKPMRKLMEGVKAIGNSAIANDLSLFATVDGQRRLWVQHGLDGDPEVIASGVQQVVWGPISRRMVVKEANGASRLYDGRDNSWTDLGIISGAQWSADEERLLVVQTEKAAGDQSRSVLSLVVGKQIRKLCSMDRIGQLRSATLSADGERAFLLASLEQNLDVWMMSLTPRSITEKQPKRPQPQPEKRQIIIH
jgi:hypothetical protein